MSDAQQRVVSAAAANAAAAAAGDKTLVPTISGFLSSNVQQQGNAPPSTKDIVQQMFKDNEQVLTLFETFQIVGQEYQNRLLIVVERNGSYALIALAVSQLPPQSVTDLQVDKFFPIIQSFQFNNCNPSGISQLQFSLRNDEEAEVKYNYYLEPTCDGTVDFETFYAQVNSIKSSNPCMDVMHELLDYSWLNEYRPVGELGLKQELKRREHEYMVYKDYKVYCATWNVNNKPYNDNCPLHLWLAATDEPADIYAIGLQELDTSKISIAISENRPDQLWITQMLNSVHKSDKYVSLISVRLVGMQLTIIVRRQIRDNITRCKVKYIASGLRVLGSKLGNKGGVAVSLKLNEDNFCFVNSHLAAHMEFVQERNDNFMEILRETVFDDNRRRTINDHDHIFWIGDLNYRIDNFTGIINRDTCPIPRLLEADQLIREMQKGKCFQGYSEGHINFKPTYKYDVGTDNYDSSEKQREPAYCDRILWKGKRIKQLCYNSVMQIRHSDHKPVYALFNVQVKSRDETLFKRVHEEVLKLVDKRENESQPQLKLETNVIDFGLVRFNEEAVSDFNITNPCSVRVDFMFKNKSATLDDNNHDRAAGSLDDICEKWLQVEPKEGSLLPESVKSVRLRMLADHRCIAGLLRKIPAKAESTDFDILVLSVRNGRDIFIPITGEYKPSCFGLSMETLCRTEKPLCEYTQAQVKKLMMDTSPKYRLSMPREYFLLIDYLYKQGEKVKGAFKTPLYDYIHKVQFNEIRDWLDSWSENVFPGPTIAAAEALMLLLDLPEEPLLAPFEEDLLRTVNIAEAMDLIPLLSSPKRNVFLHLCMFLRDGIDKKYYDLHNVANVFGPILLGKSKPTDTYRDMRCREFMHRFICTDFQTLSNATTVNDDGNVWQNNQNNAACNHIADFT